MIAPSLLRSPSIYFDPSTNDIARLNYALIQLARLGFSMGATSVFPGILGTKTELTQWSDCVKLQNLSSDPRNYFLGAGHLFGSCRMGGAPAASVVNPQVPGTRNQTSVCR